MSNALQTVSYLGSDWTVTDVRGDYLVLVRGDGYRMTVHGSAVRQ